MSRARRAGGWALPPLVVLLLLLVTAGRAAAAPDPVVPFPVQTYPCDQLPAGWPEPQRVDPWCGTWDAGITTPDRPDAFPVASLGHITLRRISADDAQTVFFYDTADAAAFPPLTDLTDTGFASNDCNQMLADRVWSTRYYLGTYAVGDERGYVGACSDLGNFPNVLNGGFVSQTSADPAIDRWQRIRRRGDLSLRWTVSGDPLVVEGELRPFFPVESGHVGATYWLFDAVREGAWPPAPGSGGATVPRPKPAVPPGSLSSQPPIVGAPLFRILAIGGDANSLQSSGGEGKSRTPRVGWFLGEGDVLGVRSRYRAGAPPGGEAWARLQALPGGAVVEVSESYGWPGTGAVFVAHQAPSLGAGEARVTGDGVIATPTASVRVGTGTAPGGTQHADAAPPQARVSYDRAAEETTVADRAGDVRVVPMNLTLAGIRLVPGQQVRVGRRTAGPPFDETTADLATTIPAPRAVRVGPASAIAPARLSLRALAHSKCVRVAVASTRPARVMVTIFSGRRSIRLFGQRLVRFARPGRVTTCIRVPRRARTFDVRTPLGFAVGYALGLRDRPGQRPARPAIRTIRLVP